MAQRIKILVANNALPALKFILSIRKTKHRVDFIGLARKEDLNSDYIKYLSMVEILEDGPSQNNFTNMDVIVNIAKKHKVDFVWPGWGYLSEESSFSQTLHDSGIGFLGPGHFAMRVLGDKYFSALMCKNLGIPFIPYERLSINAESKNCKVNGDKLSFEDVMIAMMRDNKYDQTNMHSCINSIESIPEHSKIIKGIERSVNYIHRVFRYFKKEKKEEDYFRNLEEINSDLINEAKRRYGNTIVNYYINKLKKKSLHEAERDILKFRNYIYNNEENNIATIMKNDGYNIKKCTIKKDYNVGKQSNIKKSEHDMHDIKNNDLVVNAKKNGNDFSELKNMLLKFVKENGYPVILKSSQSGGGKGIRVINDDRDLLDNYESVRFEGSGETMICKVIKDARHIEFQLAGDKFGNIICLGGRDCTIQRRHQKIIEESLGKKDFYIPFYDRMKKDCINLIRESKYVGVATVEFLCTKEEYYFLEVNTRIQVEHPITEIKYNVNIPEIQLLIGMGKDISKYRIRRSNKHVLGVRIYSENPWKDFLPVTGQVKINHIGSINSFGYFSFQQGEIGKYNDSQFGHVFVKERTRKKSIKKMIGILKDINIEGIHNNIEYIIELLKSKIFNENQYHIKTIEEIMKIYKETGIKNMDILNQINNQRSNLHDKIKTKIYTKEDHHRNQSNLTGLENSDIRTEKHNNPLNLNNLKNTNEEENNNQSNLNSLEKVNEHEDQLNSNSLSHIKTTNMIHNKFKHSSNNLLNDKNITNRDNIDQVKYCSNNLLADKNLTNRDNIDQVKYCSNNLLTDKNITNRDNIDQVKYCSNNLLNDKNITNRDNIDQVKYCSNNLLNDKNITNRDNIDQVKYCSNNLLTDKNITNRDNIDQVKYCSNNLLNDKNITNRDNIDQVKYCSNNLLNDKNITNRDNIDQVKYCSNNLLNDKNITNRDNIDQVKYCSNNLLTDNEIVKRYDKETQGIDPFISFAILYTLKSARSFNDIEFIFDEYLYKINAYRIDKNSYILEMNNSLLKLSFMENNEKYFIFTESRFDIVNLISKENSFLLYTRNGIHDFYLNTIEFSLGAPTDGKITKIYIEDNQEVYKGDKVMEIEIMKLRMPIETPFSGNITFKKKENSVVKEGDKLAIISSKESIKYQKYTKTFYSNINNLSCLDKKYNRKEISNYIHGTLDNDGTCDHTNLCLSSININHGNHNHTKVCLCNNSTNINIILDNYNVDESYNKNNDKNINLYVEKHPIDKDNLNHYINKTDEDITNDNLNHYSNKTNEKISKGNLNHYSNKTYKDNSNNFNSEIDKDIEDNNMNHFVDSILNSDPCIGIFFPLFNDYCLPQIFFKRLKHLNEIRFEDIYKSINLFYGCKNITKNILEFMEIVLEKAICFFENKNILKIQESLIEIISLIDKIIIGKKLKDEIYSLFVSLRMHLCEYKFKTTNFYYQDKISEKDAEEYINKTCCYKEGILFALKNIEQGRQILIKKYIKSIFGKIFDSVNVKDEKEIYFECMLRNKEAFLKGIFLYCNDNCPKKIKNKEKKDNDMFFIHYNCKQDEIIGDFYIDTHDKAPFITYRYDKENMICDLELKNIVLSRIDQKNAACNYNNNMNDRDINTINKVNIRHNDNMNNYNMKDRDINAIHKDNIRHNDNMNNYNMKDRDINAIHDNICHNDDINNINMKDRDINAIHKVNICHNDDVNKYNMKDRDINAIHKDNICHNDDINNINMNDRDVNMCHTNDMCNDGICRNTHMNTINNSDMNKDNICETNSVSINTAGDDNTNRDSTSYYTNINYDSDKKYRNNIINIQSLKQKIIFKDIFRNLCIFLEEKRFVVLYKIDTHSGNSILDVSNLSHAIKQILCSLKINNIKHSITESVFIIDVEGKIKLSLDDVNRITDDCIFYNSKGYIENGVIEFEVIFRNDSEYKLHYSIERGVLEKKILCDRKIIEYQIENKIIYSKLKHIDNEFNNKAIEYTNILENENTFDQKKFVSLILEEKKIRKKELARKNNTILIDDMIYFIRIYFYRKKMNIEISEIFLKRKKDLINQKNNYDENIISFDKNTYVLHCNDTKSPKNDGKRNLVEDESNNKELLVIGMRAFIMKYNDNKFVVIQNDITFQNGSFSILEDIFYSLSLRKSRKEKLPFIFITCNSGARIGLDSKLIENISYKDGNFIAEKVLANDSKLVENKTREEKDFIAEKPKTNDSKLVENKTREEKDFIAEKPKTNDSKLVENKTFEDGNNVYDDVVIKNNNEIIAVYGNTYSGSENLSFSGLIASETRKAYEEILFISYVTGRSVGIGSYINKLGQRIIQKIKSPIILTGFQSINKLNQSNIYSSNEQIGGSEIMSGNGNSHKEVMNDYEGIEEICRWIDFYYNRRSKNIFNKEYAVDKNKNLKSKKSNKYMKNRCEKIDESNKCIKNLFFSEKTINHTLESSQFYEYTRNKSNEYIGSLGEEKRILEGNKSDEYIDNRSNNEKKKLEKNKSDECINNRSDETNDINVGYNNTSFYNHENFCKKSFENSRNDCLNDTEIKKDYFIRKTTDLKFKETFNEREILEYLMDNEAYTEYKTKFASNIIIARGKINKKSIGIISTESRDSFNGNEITKNVLFPDSSEKIAQGISDFEKEGLDILIIANFKGFAGGKEEMEKNVLKYGSLIVETLGKCKTRICIYIPPGGEVRGGSWVVFDKNINKNISIICHPRSWIGIMQPDAIADLKFKENQRKIFMESNNLAFSKEEAEEIAGKFCSLHDSPFRMFKNNIIDDILFVDELKRFIINNILED